MQGSECKSSTLHDLQILRFVAHAGHLSEMTQYFSVWPLGAAEDLLTGPTGPPEGASAELCREIDRRRLQVRVEAMHVRFSEGLARMGCISSRSHSDRQVLKLSLSEPGRAKVKNQSWRESTESVVQLQVFEAG